MSTKPDDNGSESQSRRQVLRWMVLAAVGVGIAVVGSISLTGAFESASGDADRSTASEPQASFPGEAADSGPPVTVKVVYFQMPQFVSEHQEYITLQSPANFGELLQVVTSKHPTLAAMIPSMMILIDGNVARSNSQLEYGDEVDFIPAFAGG